ncbi:MAG: hypothetical protein ACRDFB_08920 [Rhabdochlamydiaceae bacterium]
MINTIDTNKRPDFNQALFATLNGQRLISIALPFIAMYSSKTSSMISTGVGVYQCITLWTTTEKNNNKYIQTADLVITVTLGYFFPPGQLCYATLKFLLTQYFQLTQTKNWGDRGKVALQVMSHAIYLHSTISSNPLSIVLSLLSQATGELIQVYTHYHDKTVNRTPEIIASMLLAAIRLHKVSTLLPHQKQLTPPISPTHAKSHSTEPPAQNTQKQLTLSISPTHAKNHSTEPPAQNTQKQLTLPISPTHAKSHSTEPPAQDVWYKQVLEQVPKSSYLQQKDAEDSIEEMCEEGEQLCKTFAGDASRLFHDVEFDQDREDVKLGMPGVAMIASYLKEKHRLDHLYVCNSLEAFRQKLEEISHSLGDIRAALVIPWDFMYRASENEKYIGDATHKIAVCVEKKADLMKVAIIDSLSEDLANTRVIKAPAEHLTPGGNSLNIILWYIYHSQVDLSKAEIYYCQPDIQWSTFGCETFALRTAVSFLRYPHFFDKIVTSQLTIKENGNEFSLQKITHLPLVFLKGVQSRSVLCNLVGEYLEKIKLRPPIQELLDLYNALKKHVVEIDNTMRNLYISRRSHKYHQMVLTACKILSEEKIAQILKKTLLTDVSSPAPEKPRNPSDNHLTIYQQVESKEYKLLNEKEQLLLSQIATLLKKDTESVLFGLQG